MYCTFMTMYDGITTFMMETYEEATRGSVVLPRKTKKKKKREGRVRQRNEDEVMEKRKEKDEESGKENCCQNLMITPPLTLSHIGEGGKKKKEASHQDQIVTLF